MGSNPTLTAILLKTNGILQVIAVWLRPYPIENKRMEVRVRQPTHTAVVGSFFQRHGRCLCASWAMRADRSRLPAWFKRRHIAAALNASKAPTKRGGRWHAVTIQKVLGNAVYKAGG